MDFEQQLKKLVAHHVQLRTYFVTHLTQSATIVRSLQSFKQMNNSQSSPDLSVFTQQPDSCGNNHEKCSSIKRLLSALRYYSSLDIIHNQQHKDAFIQFIANTYEKLYDDYIHLVQRHGHQIENIHKDFMNDFEEMTKCNIETCSFTARHHRLDKPKQIEIDLALEIIKETMDSLHFYVVHIFDAQLRSLSLLDNDANKMKSTSAEHSKDEYYDPQLAEIRDRLIRNQHKIVRFRGFGGRNGSKFNIKIGPSQDSGDQQLENGDNVTKYLDKLYLYLESIGIAHEVIEDLHKFIQSEEYDTDSYTMDIMLHGENGNISNHISNEKCITYIVKLINSSQSM